MACVGTYNGEGECMQGGDVRRAWACNEGERKGRERERQGSPSSHALAVVRKAKVRACEGEGKGERVGEGEPRSSTEAKVTVCEGESKRGTRRPFLSCRVSWSLLGTWKKCGSIFLKFYVGGFGVSPLRNRYEPHILADKGSEW